MWTLKNIVFSYTFGAAVGLLYYCLGTLWDMGAVTVEWLRETRSAR